jgi:uncharacterized protein (TIGR02145 family)
MPKAHLFSYRLPVAETKAVARIVFPPSWDQYFPNPDSTGDVRTNDPTYGSIILCFTVGSGTSREDFVDSMVSEINDNIYGYTAVKIIPGNPNFLEFLSIYIDVTSRPGLGELNNGVQLTSEFYFDGDTLNPTQSFSGGVSANVLGCEQIGTMSVSLETTDTIGFTVGDMGNAYHGPDEDLGYVIAYSSPAGTRTHLRGTALAPNAVGFIRSSVKTYSSFVSLVNDRLGGTYSSNSIGAMVAKYRLNINGYWTSFPNLWMTENLGLDVNRYRNGDLVREEQDPAEFINLTEGAWCYYGGSYSNGQIYGKLYNWYAVNDSRGLAPVGYHIPSNAEMTILRNYLNPGAGGHMKEPGLIHWSETSAGADNSSGFTALGSGYLDPTQSFGSYFTGLGDNFNCWVSDEFDSENAYSFNIFSGNNNLNILNFTPKNYGYSVRCLKDFT